MIAGLHVIAMLRGIFLSSNENKESHDNRGFYDVQLWRISNVGGVPLASSPQHKEALSNIATIAKSHPNLRVKGPGAQPPSGPPP